MSITIKAANNGYIVTELDFSLEGEFSGQDYIYESLAEALRHANDFFEPGSRHDEKRVYVIEAPGDKHPDFMEAHANVIWGIKTETE